MKKIIFYKINDDIKRNAENIINENKRNAEEINAKDIQKLIIETNSKWLVKENEISKLSVEERRKLLGVIPPFNGEYPNLGVFIKFLPPQ